MDCVFCKNLVLMPDHMNGFRTIYLIFCSKLCVQFFESLLQSFIYIYSSMSSVNMDQGLMPDHMNKGVSQEHSSDEGYETPTDPCPSIDRAARRQLHLDLNYDPQECEVKYTSLVSYVYT
jgi:hypothetical protein